MAKNRNTHLKNLREMEKRRKAEEKRTRRRKKKEEANGNAEPDIGTPSGMEEENRSD